MTGIIDVLKQEREITSKAVKKLRASVKNEVSKSGETRSGNAVKISNAGSRFKNNRLQRLTMSAPYYIFMQHHGFEGKKSNGINQRLTATNVFSKAIQSSNIMETLANEISDVRLEQVSSIINLQING
ncbi:hypothetical protein [Flavobacterium panacagri]|uniref:hypothetical protein n=1 Tax=Flavobacterium panacagri TaxID=3034146 RepID=UPI0025A631F8|nr:hypothetical protein [Flavobacterium panacagri]